MLRNNTRHIKCVKLFAPNFMFYKQKNSRNKNIKLFHKYNYKNSTPVVLKIVLNHLISV